MFNAAAGYTPMGQHASPSSASSRRSEGPEILRDPSTAETDRQFAIAMHLTPLGMFVAGPLAFFIPLILWLIRKEHSVFADDHGREVVNFLLSYLLLSIVLAITIIGPVILLIVGIVNMIRGAVAASNGTYFRYPLTIRFLS